MSNWEQSSRFALFLDDVRESDAKELLQELDIAGADSYPTKSKVIVSSRDRTALLNGVTVTIPEPHIVGQEKASAILEKFLIYDVEAKNIGVFCKGGSGKTLLLETLFHSQKVRTHFSNGLLLRLTVSEGPSLCTQIARQNSVDSIQDIKEEEVKKWLKQKLDESNRFVLFLEDVWERDARNLFQELGILDAVSENTESKVIVSSRDLTALLKMGIEDKYTITIKEPYIVGQNLVLESLQKLVIADAEAKNIGVFGKCGSGKTLLLRTVFNSQEVRTHFSDSLLLWLTVSQMSFTSLMNDLCKQIAIQKKTVFNTAIKEEEEKTWLNEQLQQSSRFALFLDDACERNATKLLEGLGISEHSNSKVIVSYRDPNASSDVGVAEEYRITIPDLNQDDSWQLFKHHAFPYNNGNLPSNINEEKAKRLCDKCGGLPRAIHSSREGNGGQYSSTAVRMGMGCSQPVKSNPSYNRRQWATPGCPSYSRRQNAVEAATPGCLPKVEFRHTGQPGL
jgi:hypothetical protein